ncbi:unnamed protein product, partial [Musa textilis]
GYLVLPLQKDLLVEVGSLIGEGFGSGCRSDDRTTINRFAFTFSQLTLLQTIFICCLIYST